MRERFKKKKRKIRSRGSDVKIDFQFSWGSINLNSFENELTVFTKKITKKEKKKKKERKKENRGETRRKKRKEKKKEKNFLFKPPCQKSQF